MDSGGQWSWICFMLQLTPDSNTTKPTHARIINTDNLVRKKGHYSQTRGAFSTFKLKIVTPIATGNCIRHAASVYSSPVQNAGSRVLPTLVGTGQFWPPLSFFDHLSLAFDHLLIIMRAGLLLCPAVHLVTCYVSARLNNSVVRVITIVFLIQPHNAPKALSIIFIRFFFLLIN